MTHAATRLTADLIDNSADRHIWHAYQQMKIARVDGDYRRILSWTAQLDALLDERIGHCGEELGST